MGEKVTLGDAEVVQDVPTQGQVAAQVAIHIEQARSKPKHPHQQCNEQQVWKARQKKEP
jgi:hypothetical protein